MFYTDYILSGKWDMCEIFFDTFKPPFNWIPRSIHFCVTFLCKKLKHARLYSFFKYSRSTYVLSSYICKRRLFIINCLSSALTILETLQMVISCPIDSNGPYKCSIIPTGILTNWRLTPFRIFWPEYMALWRTSFIISINLWLLSMTLTQLSCCALFLYVCYV